MNQRLIRLVVAALVFCLRFADGNDAGAIGYQFTKIADTTTVIDAFELTDFSISPSPSIQGETVAVWAAYQDDVGTPNGRGIFYGLPESVYAVVGTAVPFGGGALVNFSEPAISGNRVAFLGVHCPSASGVCLGSRITSVFRDNFLVAQVGGVGPIGAYTEFTSRPSISGTNVAFEAKVDSGESGIFINDSAVAAQTGGTIPEGTFTGFGASAGKSISATVSGSFAAFWGQYSDSITTGQGIFVGDGRELRTIANTGDVAPVGGTFTLFEAPSFSGNTVAFQGTNTGGMQAVYTSNNGVLTTVAKEGDAAPGGGTFDSFGDSTPIGGSSVAFMGSYGNAAAGPGIFAKEDGQLEAVIRPGRVLFGSIVQSNSLRLGPLGIDPGGSGNVAFYYELADGRKGVALAVPTPLAGDFNEDGFVNAADYSVWRTHLGSDFDLGGNGNEDGESFGVVDRADYNLWVQHYGETFPPIEETAVGSSAVPEPATMAIAISSLVLLLVRRRKDQSSTVLGEELSHTAKIMADE